MCYFLGSLELQMPCFGVFCVGGLASPGAEDQDSEGDGATGSYT